MCIVTFVRGIKTPKEQISPHDKDMCTNRRARTHSHTGTQNFAPASLWIYICIKKIALKVLRRPSLHRSSKHVSHPRVFASHRCFFFFSLSRILKSVTSRALKKKKKTTPHPHLLILALSSYLNIPSYTKSGKKKRKEKKRVRVKRPEPSGHLKVPPRISGWQSGILQKRKEKEKK